MNFRPHRLLVLTSFSVLVACAGGPSAPRVASEPPTPRVPAAAGAGALVLDGGTAVPSPDVPPAVGDIVLVGARVYASPDAKFLDDATVFVKGGIIQKIGKRGDVSLPASVPVVDCAGKVVVAGFWNSHVHFTESQWENATTAPARALEENLRNMLLRWGFSTVFDLGSASANTLALRSRIERGEIVGPRIFHAVTLFPKGPNPSYLSGKDLAKATTPAEAATMVHDAFSRDGGDALKLFTGAYQGHGKPVVNMDAAIAKAAADVAHQLGKPAFSHPQNRIGVDNALDAGVDILAHTIPSEGSFTDAEIARMKKQHVGLIPTLALWRIVMTGASASEAQQYMDGGVRETHDYFRAGGAILFGTDVGFHQEYDTTHEMEYLARALPWQAILAALTTEPAAFFKATDVGRVAAGLRADLVVLNGDPATDVRNLSRVAYTIRNGKIIYRQRD